MSRRLCRNPRCISAVPGKRADLDALRLSPRAAYCMEACSKAHRRAEPDPARREAQGPDTARTGTRKPTRYVIVRKPRAVKTVEAGRRENAIRDAGVNPATHLAIPERQFGAGA